MASSSDGAKLVALVFNGYVCTSADSGVTWTPRVSSGFQYWISVASSSDGNKLVATVSHGYVYTHSPTSSTALGSAGSLQGGQFAAIELQYIGNGQFIPLSSAGTINSF